MISQNQILLDEKISTLASTSEAKVGEMAYLTSGLAKDGRLGRSSLTPLLFFVP